MKLIQFVQSFVTSPFISPDSIATLDARGLQTTTESHKAKYLTRRLATRLRDARPTVRFTGGIVTEPSVISG
jgi:hypothetical protein